MRKAHRLEMMRVYSSIVHDHDPWSVGVAALICLMAAFTAFSIVEQARRSAGRRNAWLIAAGAVSGTGIWATHFVAMLAYRPHMAVGYDLRLTFLSILAAILLTGAGWWVSLRPERWAPLGAGAVIGAGIATMHYTGMAAVTMAGRLVYDPSLVAASAGIGIALTAIAIAVRRKRAREHPHKVPWIATLLFTLAICGMHFTGMGAARMVRDPRLATPSSSIGAESLGVAVTLIAIMILAIGLAVVLFDRKLSRRALEEAERLRSFADAAVEGLVVIDGHAIVDVNQSFLAIAGYPDSAACPRSLSMLLPDFDPDRLPLAHGAEATECRLVTAGGGECPVEILVRPLDWAGAELRILAIRDIRERKEAAARIAHLAYRDALTGLPNRTVFAEHLARTIDKAHGQPIAVLCLDLDGFKAVNDMYGHPIGDELLVEASHRLLLAAGPDCLVSRLGGDEFAIIQRGGDQPIHAGQVAERAIASLGEQFLLEGQMIRIGCSIGIALYPDDATTPAALVKNADMALYRAKAEGGRTARFYEPAMDEALRWRRQMEAELRLAIEFGQLEVHYQPLADLETGAILSFEALLRWFHPTLGAISPEIFIPLAEECGYIATLGEWVLRQACSEAAGWQPRLRLSVNLSPLQFMPGHLIATVERVLAETGLDAARLDLEVTEGLLIKDAETALEILAGLKALGVQISMDDFGTGYASLSYFRMFPFDKVKIDRSFVNDMMGNPQARAIIRSVIGLGQGLGMPVIAEGVETQEQFDTLRAEGCNQVQGFLISRPGPIRNFDQVIVERAGGQTNSGKRRRAA
jgi:diguanylate cyclase (GGDEF)-like protein/PAS domain S-box-containing protein